MTWKVAGLLFLAGCHSTGSTSAQRNRIGKYKLEIGEPRSIAELRHRSLEAKRRQPTEGRLLQASDVPEAPTSVSAEQSGLRTVVVSWDAPEDNGSTITMYEVTYYRAGAEEGVMTTNDPALTSVTVDGLITGSTYSFSVRAISSAGDGAQSATGGEVVLTPGSFTTLPTVMLESLVAGHDGSATVTFTVGNPLPVDGNIFVEFPPEFESINATAASGRTGIDGGLAVTMSDTRTVQVARDGTGSVVSAGTEIVLALSGGIKNQLYEGTSSVFPLLKTTLAGADVAIDVASTELNGEDRIQAVEFVPGSFTGQPAVALDSLVAGHDGSATVTFTVGNPLPVDGNIFVEFPPEFESINATAASGRTGIDGGLAVTMSDTRTVQVARDGTGSVVSAGTEIVLALSGGIKNQLYEGTSSVFPLLKTTLAGADVAIDVASTELNGEDRIQAVEFVPGSFTGQPAVALDSLVAGHDGSATVTFTVGNPLPVDGNIFVEFPPEFESINATAASGRTGIDGGLAVTMSDTRTVQVARDGTGSVVSAGTEIVLALSGGIKNQLYEGTSSVFPLLKTTLAGADVAIDVASTELNGEDRIQAVEFVPGSFTGQPAVALDSLVAGHDGSATVTFTVGNPLPVDGNIFVEFPPEFESINATAASGRTGIDGGLAVTMSDTRTVQVARDGTGSVVSAGTEIVLALSGGIKNQLYEGTSSVFPLLKTTLAGADVAIDVASTELNGEDRIQAVEFVPGSFTGQPAVALDSLVAGHDGSATVTFTVGNPLPVDGNIFVEFPPEFESINATAASGRTGIDGGLAVTMSDTRTVQVARDGTGSVVSAGTEIVLALSGGIKNQLYEGTSSVFPLLKTTLAGADVAIDVASTELNGEDRIQAVEFVPGSFTGQPAVALDSLVAGHDGSATVTFTVGNPLPVDGNIFVEFPPEFESINATAASGRTGIDGGLAVTMSDTRTVQVARDGTGSVVSAGTEIVLALSGGIKNQLYEGTSSVFPLLKTTLAGADVAIDVASTELNGEDRIQAVEFVPGSFTGQPAVALDSLVAGHDGSATVTFTVGNPLPVDGNIFVEFPPEFESINATAASGRTGIDGGLAVTMSDTRTVQVARDGTGSVVSAGTEIVLALSGGIKNQLYEGTSSVFPLLKTTLAGADVAIDVASTELNGEDRIQAVEFVPGSFTGQPAVALDSLVAGHDGSATVTFTVGNPLPVDGNIFVEFPPEFESINATAASGRTGIDGGLAVTMSDTRTVQVARDGTGSVVSAGTEIVLALSGGIKNQLYEGTSSVFPLLKTTLAGADVAIDVASTELNGEDRIQAVEFVPGSFTGQPAVALDSLVAGHDGSATVTFTVGNPLPVDGNIFVEFPPEFESINATAASGRTGIDGGLAVTMSDTRTVQVARDGTGSVVSAGTEIVLALSGGIKNQLYEGTSSVFPLLKTTLAGADVAIDVASTELNGEDRIQAVEFVPGSFTGQPAVALDSLVAGHDGSATVTFTVGNPLPVDGNIFVEFPPEFESINATAASGRTGIDGGLAVTMSDTRTVQVARDGTGSVVSAGTEIVLALSGGIKNQLYEGTSSVFPLLKTTLAGADVAIDVASTELNGEDRIQAVEFVPGSFTGQPAVALDSLVAGHDGSATVTFTVGNPLPVDGNIFVEFPPEFESINATAASGRTGIDGGLAVTMSDTRTVQVARDGTGSVVSAGTEIVLALSGGIKNQLYEGTSSVFPLLKTTLAGADVAIDVASTELNGEDRIQAVEFVPGSFTGQPAVALDSLVAGHDGSATVTFTVGNPLPVDGNIFVEFPPEFESINATAASGRTGIDGGLAVTMSDTRTVQVARDGTGSVVSAGTEIVLALSGGIKNQLYEGTSSVFPLLKTTLAGADVAIDVASTELNGEDRIQAVEFVPGSFTGQPAVALDSLVAGHDGSATVTFTVGNPLPGDGNIFVEFPPEFESINATAASGRTGIDGGLAVTMSDTRTVQVARDGTGSVVSAGTEIVLALSGGIKNQLYEGTSSVFPLLKTTLAGADVAIDVASTELNGEDRIQAVEFVPGSFTGQPAVALDSLVAGHDGSATVTFTVGNPLPVDGNIFVEFPPEFESINATAASGRTGIDGGLAVTMSDTRTVQVARDGTGSVVSAGTEIVLALSGGIKNQLYEGTSSVFPLLKTTLAGADVAIDVASTELNGEDRIQAVEFVPGSFTGQPAVALDSLVAGHDGSATVTFTVGNPLPVDGNIFVEFPPEFESINATAASGRTGIDGGLAVTMSDTRTVQVARDGTGSVVSAGTEIVLALSGGIKNQLYEGTSSVFPLLKTTLAGADVAIDVASTELNGEDRIQAVEFVPGSFTGQPAVALDSLVAGHDGSATVTFTVGNPLPVDGNIFVEFPPEFESINATAASGRTGIDGGLAVTMSDTRTVQVARDGTGSVVSAGTEIVLALSGGIKNQLYEGTSSVFPLLKTTLAGADVAIDVASTELNGEDRIQAVEFVPGSFTGQPAVALDSLVAGHDGSATVTFTVGNPLPVDGNIFVEFPPEFESINATAASGRTGIDGGLAVTMSDTRTVQVARDGTGSVVSAGTEIVLALSGGIKNQLYEGTSSVFPLLKTTLAGADVAIDVASTELNGEDRIQAVEFVPGSFTGQPAVALDSLVAGHDGSATVTFTVGNPLPVDGNIFVEFPPEFESINATAASGRTGIDGGLAVTMSDTRTVQVARDGTGSVVSAGTEIVLALSGGIKNQLYEGTSSVFPLLKTTLAGADVAIDVASTELNGEDRIQAVEFVPGSFTGQPAVALDSLVAGHDGSATVTFTVGNPLPVDGNIFVEFPPEFESINATAASGRTGIDGGLAVTMSDTRTVQVARDGTGSVVSAGTEIVLALSGGIKNQLYEGTSSVFPLLKTTLAGADVAIDVASTELNGEDRIQAVEFVPGSFTGQPAVALDSLVAGHDGSATVTFTVGNPLPVDGNIFVEFPPEFESINATAASGRTGIDGGLAVTMSDTRTVQVARDGTGSVVSAGTEIVLALSGGIKNQLYEGTSSVFPLLKTTLAGADVAIDVASTELNGEDRIQAVEFVPGSFTGQPAVALDSLVAGHVGSATVTFTVGNPLPVDGNIFVEFPPEFESINATAASGRTGIDGGLAVTMSDTRTVQVARDGTGSVVSAGTEIVLALSGGIKNQLYEGTSSVFPLLKTTLAGADVAIDVASTELNGEDRIQAVEFVPGSFTGQPAVALDSLVAGHDGSATVTFTVGNPLPVDGNIFVEFPPEFESINATAASGRTGIDGGLAVTMSDTRTVQVARDGTGSVVSAGTEIVLALSGGIKNQLYEGTSSVFPLLKTTLAGADVAIDVASTELNGEDRIQAVEFVPGSFTGQPAVALDSLVAGHVGSATVTFTVGNPLPVDGNIFVEFPPEFESINATAASGRTGIDGGLAVTMSDTRTVQVARDGTGSVVSAGTEIVLALSGGIKNQLYEGTSSVFPLLKTTLAGADVAIDVASTELNGEDRIQAVEFVPGSFTGQPAVALDSLVAGHDGSATVTFTVGNPLPVDGNIFVEFPPEFESINATAASGRTGIDGGLAVTMSDTRTVQVARDGTGSVVSAGTEIVLALSGGIKNQLYEGTSSVFPLLKTTLAGADVAIDVASTELNGEDRIQAVEFVPGSFTGQPAVALDSLEAGHDGSATVTFTVGNPLPVDGNIFVEFPPEFESINATAASGRTGIDGGLAVTMSDTRTVQVARDGTGSVVSAGTEIVLALSGGIKNQLYEGTSSVFPLLKTTLAGADVAIDVASTELNGEDRIQAVEFVPGSFTGQPAVALDSLVAGHVGSATVTFTVGNPLPVDGNIFVEFPPEFESINATAASGRTGIDGGLAVTMSDTRTVQVARDGTGSVVSAGTEIVLALSGGIKNQLYEGTSSVFPLLKTTLAGADVAIDVASTELNGEDRIQAVEFVPGSFTGQPAVALDSLVAGHDGSATVTFTVGNPLPVDGNIFVEFPPEFESINATAASGRTGIDGGLAVTMSDTRTVQVARDGTGSVVSAGTEIVLALSGGIKNQLYEGTSSVFPLLKTTLAGADVAIDVASTELNGEDRIQAVEFVPGSFTGQPAVALDSLVAGHVGSATVTFTVGNPLPVDGNIFVEFPPEFESINATAASGRTGIDGGLAVTMSDTRTVQVARDGTGSVVSAGTEIVLALSGGIKNQLYEGTSSVFPLLKTTLAGADVAIDVASTELNGEDRIQAVEFVPGSFTGQPAVALDSLVAGHDGSATVTFTVGNPLPVDGNIFVEFPPEFESINATAASGRTGIDGGLAVTMSDTRTVQVARDGTGSVVSAGTEIVLALSGGIKNQLYEGTSSVFPLLKTTLAGADVAIDVASTELNGEDRIQAVEFVPGSFTGQPAVALDSLVAGHVGSATVTFTVGNPLPVDGNIFVEFPPEFESINPSRASGTGIDGYLQVFVIDTYTVRVTRSGGTEMEAGTQIVLIFVDGIENQLYEGTSSVFPLLKTTLADTSVAIDEASTGFYDAVRPELVEFVPGSFTGQPTVSLGSLVAGHDGSATVTFTVGNPLPADGNIFVEFPPEFESISPTAVSGTGIDGGLQVSMSGHMVRVQRNGGGTQVEVDTEIVLTLSDGIENQLYEGPSSIFPLLKTTLADTDVAIDEASSDFNDADRPEAVSFAAASMLGVSTALSYDVAAMETSITFTFTIANPLPLMSLVYIEFPSGFLSASPSSAESEVLGTLAVDGSFALAVERDGSGDIVPSGSTISLTLSTVTNRDSVGDTGEFSLTTFTDSSMGNRIDVGVAASVEVGKQILSATAAFGSSSVAVAAQNKRWTFFGHGVALEDQVKWVSSSATSDENCFDGDAEEIDIDAVDGDSSSTDVVFAESSELTGPLQLCYRFSTGDHPFKLYPAITVDVYELYNVVAAEEGSTSVSVVGYAKVLTLSGFGTAEFDQAKWILEGSADCLSAPDVASLASGGDGGDNVSLVSSSFQASFEFTEEVFTQTEAGSASAIATLCYKFGSEDFQNYPSVSMGIHFVGGWTSTVGSPSVAVADVSEDLSFTGYGISESDSVTDRARWILSGTSCSENIAPISDATATDGQVDVVDGQATFTFMSSASGETPVLCYWFQEEPGVYLSSLTINVAFLSTLSASSFGDDDVAVVGYPKSWTFAGGHIEDGDFVRWIFDDSSDCTDESSLPELQEGGEIISGETTCTFAESVSGRWITPCYRHSSEPWRRYSMPVYVKMVHSMTASWGSDQNCVVDQPKQWAFEGDGLTPSGHTDLIKFVIDDTDCASESDAPLTEADSDGVAMFLATDSTSTFTIESAAAGQLVNLCYKFGNEEYMWYDIQAFAHMVQFVDSRVGGEDIAVVDVEEVMVVHAHGTSTQDLIRWVVSDDTSDAACSDTISVWDTPVEGANEITDVPIYDQEDSFLADFTFSASSAGLSPTLCYKFADEPWKIYPDVTIDVAMLQEVHANEGSDNVAVVDYSKMWTMVGTFLAAGDQVFWSVSTCEADAAATLVGDDDNILDVDSTLAPWFVFDSLASGLVVHICYKFNDEPFKEYEEFEIDIRMIRAVAVDIGSPQKTIPDVAKTFSFIGDGTASEAGLDQVKWIDGVNCSANGVVGDVEDAEGIYDFDLLYLDATGFTAQTIVFPEAEIGGPYVMCYSFDEEPYQIYEDLVMTVLGISHVTAEEGAAGTIVVGAPKRLTFTGGGAVEAGDQVVWVSGGRIDSDCTVAAFLSGPESTVDSLNGAEFLIPDEDGEEKAGQTWTLCYRFGTESFKIYPPFSLTAVTLVGFSAEAGSDDDSVVGYPKTFHPTGFGVAEGDMAKWILDSASTDEGCEADGVVDESAVELVAYTEVWEPATDDQIAANSSTPSESLAATMSSSGERLVLSSTFTFTTPTFSSARVQLCYKHQGEPFHLHPSITLRSRKLQSATIRELGTEQALTSITNSPQLVAFVAVGGMEGDRYKWVATTGSSSSEALFDLCAEDVDPAAGSWVGVAGGFYQEASFTFTETASGLMLCYGPGSEPFMPYPEITMEVLAPIISAANTTHVVVGRSTPVRLVGTFGLTSGDALKLASNADGDCDGEAAGGDETVFYPDATAAGYSGTALGTSTISIHVSDRTEENRPYKLCYRFGAAGGWELFDNVSFEAYEITAVSINTGDVSPAAGDSLDFSFFGTGVVDGDLAKWVGDNSVLSDGECEAAPSAAGSSTATVFGGVGTFTFNGDVEDWILCYKHSSNDWRLYTGIIPVSASTTSSPDSAVSDTQRTRADVSFTMEGDISSYPEGSDARTAFLEAFLTDLARALEVDTARFTITDVRGGSVVIDFTVEPTGSLADPSVTELLTNLDVQVSDESSTLMAGDVTSAAKGLAYTTIVVADSASTGSSATMGLSVVEHQPKGLFGFTSVVWYTTEASEKITLTIERDHGTKGVMDIGYTTSDGTATGGDDYTSVAGTVRFYDGDTSRTVDIALVDDEEKEAHFETFTVALSLEGPINDGAALMTAASEATVLLYDFGDGFVLAEATFSTESTASEVEDLALGWTITDNGGHSGWVDSNGFAAKDEVVGADEYGNFTISQGFFTNQSEGHAVFFDDRCDFAATAPCDHDCTFGGGLAELFPTTGESPSVARLNSTGYVTTIDPITDFPSNTLSIAFWVRAISTSGGRGGGTALSYVASNASPGDFEVLLHNLNSLSLIVHGKYVAAADRYDGPSGGDMGGITTGIDIARDGAWHHVAVAWRSADGRVDAFLDGARVFDGGPYKTGAVLPAGGRLVLGQAQSSDCTSAEDVLVSGPPECDIASGETGPGGLEAEVQHVRLWSKFVTADEVAQQMHDPFKGNSVGQVLHWDFTPARVEGGVVEDSSGIGVSTSGTANDGLLSENGVDLVQASPSLNPGYPCGVVHSGIWRFAGSEDFVLGLRNTTSYGGRLQFRLAYSAAIGDIRSTRGAVLIRSQSGEEISWNLVFDVAGAAPGDWTHISVVLREDHGWLHEPLGTGVTTAEMKDILENTSEILIRGDLRVYGRGGGGQEVVYVQDVRLMAKG